MFTHKNVITRFAPSPTGFLHVGGMRTALFNYLFAKQHGGKFILRIEDTDKERSKKEYEEDILAGLSWLSLSYDEIYRQSERGEIYQKHLAKMLLEGMAYEAEDNSDGTGKVIRFKNPNEKIAFEDVIRGNIEFDTTELGDFVIAKDMHTPLYHLAVVVDDFEMGVTHIIRGEDHISNTPRQILIQRALHAPLPIYAHIPLILASDKSKLSKRHGAVSVNEYRKEGYLPEALINFLALLGWNPGTEKEIFTLVELIKEFNIEKVQKGGAVFNTEKLDWINKEHLKKISPKDLEVRVAEALNVQDSIMVEKITPIILERINKINDIKKMATEGEWTYFFEAPRIDEAKLAWKDSTPEAAKKHLAEIANLLESADFSSADSIKRAVWDYAEKEGRGAVLWPFRYTLSGREKSPDPFTIASILGKEETLERLRTASAKLSQ
ncbi:MAG: glutamate--tRNA ligase [Patescibacteria group bacterium]|nr:glutamate--tRNA ligase [Patescibacteria group bacterium]